MTADAEAILAELNDARDKLVAARDRIAAMRAERDTLVRGWRALKAVSDHDLDGCQPCRRYAAALWQGGKPREWDHLRCEPMRAAQADINAADTIANAEQP